MEEKDPNLPTSNADRNVGGGSNVETTCSIAKRGPRLVHFHPKPVIPFRV